MQKLAVSKQIMDAQEGKKVDPQAIQERMTSQPNYNMESIQNNVIHDPMDKPVNEQSIMNSNLPDEIKKLMIENPIQQPNQNNQVISQDIIEGAARLINKNTKTNKVQESTNIQTSLDQNSLKNMIRDVVRDVVRDTVKETVQEQLKDKIILSEGGNSVKDKLTFKVGNHLFEGVVTKIKKIK